MGLILGFLLRWPRGVLFSLGVLNLATVRGPNNAQNISVGSWNLLTLGGGQGVALGRSGVPDLPVLKASLVAGPRGARQMIL